jgi:hypothetical protein
MKTIILSIAAVAFVLWLTGCSATRHVAADGSERTTLALGGRGTQAHGVMRSDGSIEFDIHEWHHERSFRDAVIAAGAMHAATQAGRTTRNADNQAATTTRHGATEGTARRQIDSDTTLGIERERTTLLLGQ